MVKKILMAAVSLAAMLPLYSANTPKWVAKAFEIAETQSADMSARVSAAGRLPRSIAKGLQGSEDWTAGFFPGVLWELYEYTGNPEWKARAEQACALLDGQQFNAADHDIGFKMQCSLGQGYALTGDSAYIQPLYRSAKTLSSRYSPQVGLIQSWEPDAARDWKFPVIIDNMMNLELLMEAYKRSGDTTLRDIAKSHADKTMRCHYRPDMSCPHVVDYDPATGDMRRFDWNNGSDDTSNSTWSRGQSWGLYGFTMMYRETGDTAYLRHAERIADFLINHPAMPADMVPYWDYTGASRSKMRDASAAAVMASALMELSAYSPKGSEYFKAGERQLRSLASDAYLAKPGTNSSFILKHATGNYLRNSELDGALSYADYYFLEGLLRYLKLSEGRPLYHLARIGDWFVEAHSLKTTVRFDGGLIEIKTPKGFTMWYDKPLTGSYRVSYSAMLPDKCCETDRVSDLNCFWGAKDPDSEGDLYRNASYRQGIFQRYKTLNLFYVGYGGNHNRTTRFRKYYGGGPGVHDSIARPLIAEYTDPDHLLKPNKWFRVEIEVTPGITTYSVNGEKLFTREVAPGECDGNFGFRLLENHTFIKDFKVEQINTENIAAL